MLRLRRAPRSTLFPYTTLFRSVVAGGLCILLAAVLDLLILGAQRALPPFATAARSEGHTSEPQSRRDPVCRRLLAKKKRKAAKGQGWRRRDRTSAGLAGRARPS